MNKTNIEWALNPDGTPGYTWNPITGCLNGCDYCYARKLANTRLKDRYLAGNTAKAGPAAYQASRSDPFYPRFWEDKIDGPIHNFRFHHIPGGQRYQDRGIFVCSMSDLFGIGVPDVWTERVLETIKQCPYDRFYLLTKQPQNLQKFSPFPDNAWVGVSVTNQAMHNEAIIILSGVEAKVKYISYEPLLNEIKLDGAYDLSEISWIIIGAQTKPNVMPKIEWVREIVEAADRAGIPVFLKDSLAPLFTKGEGYKRTAVLRQEMPEGGKLKC